jgi:hypothetical protein
MYRTCAAAFAILAAAATAAGQTTFYVDDNGPNDPGPNNPNLSDPLEDGSIDHPFDRLNEAIDAASNGDTVLVLAGTYFDTQTVNTDGKAITIRGDAGAAATIIDGFASPESTMVINSGEGTGTVIEGLTFSGGSDGSGGAVQIFGAASPIFRDCVFRLNTTDVDGSAVAISTASLATSSTSTPRFEDCLFEDNFSTEVAGGTNIDATVFALRSNPSFIRCIFRGNEAEAGSAIGAFESSGMLILECLFEDNTARIDGTVHLYNSTGTEIRLSDFVRNSANGGPAVFMRGSEALMSRCRVLGNASNGAGALLIDNSDLRVTNSIFVGNTADDGAAAFFRTNATGLFENCTITANEAADDIGGVWVSTDTVVELLNTIAIDNPDGAGSAFTNYGATSTASAYRVSYSLVPTTGLPAGAPIGAGVFVAAPGFIGLPGPGADAMWGTLDDDYGDLRLALGVSPAIDAGDAVRYAGPLGDLDGADRAVDDPASIDTGLAFASPMIDLGAYEVQVAGPAPACPADLNADGFINGADLGLLLGAWGDCD